MQRGLGKWTAVYVGVFEFATLDEGINLRWRSEMCPGRRLPEERNESRVRKTQECLNLALL